MRVLIAYDGSPGSEVVLEHLRRRRAGLLPVAEAMVLAVTDALVPAAVWTPDAMAWPLTGERLDAMEAMVRRAAAEEVRRLRAVVRNAARSLRMTLPGWTITPRVVMGAPASAILTQATAWKAELIVLGSRGRSCLQRWLLGSVARHVVNHAGCSVRIARGRVSAAGSAVSLVIGMDGSPGAHAAVEAVARRGWPQGSFARVVIVIDSHISALLGVPEVSAARLIEAQRVERDSILVMAHRAADLLRATGLLVQILIKAGDPKRVLIEEAKRWGADSLIVGATGLTRLQRLMVLGGVSTAVAVRAPCTVEVIRPAPLPMEITTPPGEVSGQITELAERRGTSEPLRVVAGSGRWVMPVNRLKQFLDVERAPYESIDHEPEYTAQRTAEATHTPGRVMAKTVLVKVDGKFAMVVIPASSRVDLERLQQEVGAQRITLAKEEEFENLFPDSEPGAEPPFGNLYGIPVFVSESLANNAQIAFNAGTHTEVVRMNYRDFERLVKPSIVSVWVARGPVSIGHGWH